MKNTGLIELTNTAEETNWSLKNEEGETVDSGALELIDLENEFFDYDLLTEKIAIESGLAIENNERHTESGPDRLYWTVSFS